ncbi:hypothetical protein H2199_005191 [Coniosporium tulheliwenetii]|uniref:Uncharacterized protein n=1 Tax=Coniosporium tulheliwenetii TaxID=3383036 RepID=A0ACC2Z2T3_9PEZI|nr:hypothetical protein H2199_005191 [Cladosporium sp. JES 115]
METYYKLIATGLGCMESVLKNWRLHPRMEAELRLRYAGLLHQETENTAQAESVLSKGITLCDRNRLLGLKYSMYLLLARVLFKTNPRAALKSLDNLIPDVEASEHTAWAYAFRFLRASLSLQVPSHPETLPALQHLRRISALADSQGDKAIFVACSAVQAMVHLQSGSMDCIEQAQRAIAAARSYQLQMTAQELGHFVTLLDFIDLACCLQQYNPEQATVKMQAMQASMDRISDEMGSTDDGSFSVLIERSSGGQATTSTGGIFQRTADGRDMLTFTWLRKLDLYLLGYYLSGVIAHLKSSIGGKAEHDLDPSFHGEAPSIIKTKQYIHTALKVAKSVANQQLLAISMSFMTAMFFKDIVGEQAEKSAKAARHLARGAGSALWTCVADGMLADTLVKHGKREEAAAVLGEARELAAQLPEELGKRAEEKRQATVTELPSYDFVIVGSGAGGGPLAARLAISGRKVLLLEAGDDQGDSIQETIPAFFPAASEYGPMSWDFFVRHYPDDAREAKNSKATYTTPSGQIYVGLNPPAGSKLQGIWYPRAGTLGGCAAHNAMITVYPYQKDWSGIQALTGDSSWAPANMRKYFTRLERNGYITTPTDPSAVGHGFNGWLGTDEVDPDLTVKDPQILSMLTAANSALKGAPAENITDIASLKRAFPQDMNSDYANRDTTQGLFRIPMAVSDGKRSSPRDFLLATANAVNVDGSKKYKLDIRLNTLVTKVRFAPSTNKKNAPPKAVGVDFLDGKSLYRADPRAGTASPGTPGRLLKLSGIGPRAELQKFNIPVVVDLPGVGANLQDHYEISTVVKYDTDFTFLKDCTFLTPGTNDACFAQWMSGLDQKGPYATNLAQAAVLMKSNTVGSDRDLFIFGGPIKFTGYFQGYTAAAVADAKHWSWLTLKSYQKNVAGDMPIINFNYFDAGTTVGGIDQLDLQTMVKSVKFSRNIYRNISAPYRVPGPNTKTDDQIKEFIKNEAWGHHATSTARIGADSDPYAVVDTRFRVKGVLGLRVVDASVFPAVPGFFPVVSVYMCSEKAADVIIADNP